MHPGPAGSEELPFVDEHQVAVDASPAVVWTALTGYVDDLLRQTEAGLVTRVLGAEPRAGFAVAASEPPHRLVLAGRHRFSRYRLVFTLADAADGATTLRALTFAVFPGVHGGVYRTLVIGSRGHVLATRHLLGSVRRRALHG